MTVTSNQKCLLWAIKKMHYFEYIFTAIIRDIKYTLLHKFNYTLLIHLLKKQYATYHFNNDLMPHPPDKLLHSVQFSKLCLFNSVIPIQLIFIDSVCSNESVEDNL